MHFSASADYPASPDAVASLFANPEFVDAKIEASRATNPSKDITGDPAGAFTVTTTRTMPADMIPQQYRKFVGGGVTLTLTEAWQAPGADGSRTGDLSLKIAGAPAAASGTCSLTPRAEGTTLTYDGDVKVSIPILGAKIERAAVTAVQQVVDAEQRVGAAWLAKN